jgi:hypothetical protein
MRFVRSDTISHRIGPHGRIALGLVDGEIHVRGIDGDEARATVQYEIEARSDEEADRIHETVRLGERRSDGFLELDEQGRDGSWSEALARLVAGGWRHGGSRIELDVEVPRQTAVRIRGVTAEVRIEGTAGDLELKSVSGDVAVEAAAANVSLDTVSGDTRIVAAGTLSLRSRTVSGDMLAAAARIAESRVSTVSGDVEIEGAFGDGGHHVETASGDLRVGAAGPLIIDVRGIAADVRSELEHRLEGSIGHRRITIGSGGPEVRFRTMSGSLVVTRPRQAFDIPAPEATDMPAPPGPADTPAPPGPADMPTQPLPVEPPRPLQPPAPIVPPSPVPPAAPPPPIPGPDDERMAVLRAVERGELDVDEALRRLGEVTHA